ncbi:DUF1658 domain-containing protein [Coxiella burnetii]|nr:DUF1658 domain-containing protein [Coxiella burnetii]PNT79329.1 DUF1658 domain-containing protein [Coxiella burnetii]PNT80432.1 DUF1658 domain-containing protein [Coxiella burnetii]PNT83666.1 DUF1658 domain-containing protein [Coxiella burnetii]PNT85944.1 DUF1658 domain-containing protein [Coxiella burnetii]
MTSAVKALDSLSIGRRPTHGNDERFLKLRLMENNLERVLNF